MGAANVTAPTIENITEATAEAITSSLQTATSNIETTQELISDCTAWTQTLSEGIKECHELWFPLVEDGTWTVEDLNAACFAWDPSNWRCGVNNVEMLQTVNAGVIGDQGAQLMAEASADIQQNLAIEMESQTGLLQFGNRFEPEIQNVVQSAQRAVAENEQEWATIVDSAQRIENVDGVIEAVSQTQMIDFAGEFLQQNQAYSQAALDLQQAVEVEMTGLSKNAIIAIAVSGAVLILIIIVASVVGHKKKQGGDGAVSVTVVRNS